MQMNVHSLYQITYQDKIPLAFPNKEVMLLLLYNLMVVSFSRKQSPLRLEKIKNEMWTSMPQEEFSVLRTMFTENYVSAYYLMISIILP